jgi:hypothetical protein
MHMYMQYGYGIDVCELMIILNLFQVPDRLSGKGEQACVMDVDTHLRGGKMDNH